MKNKIPPSDEQDFTDSFPFNEGDEVELEIMEVTDLGFNARINNEYEGLLYHSEVFETLKPGDVKRGYIKQIREDGKIDLTIQKQGYAHVKDVKHSILQKIKANKGVLPVGDKSNPEDIYRQVNMSKKTFKKAIGALYKEKLILIGDYEIKLTGK